MDLSSAIHLAIAAAFLAEVKNGGALSISEECTVTSIRTAEFINNSVLIKQLVCREGCSRYVRGKSYVVKKGGAIHNKGELTFQGDASFLGCYSQTEEAEEISRGGAISNTASGIIHFMGDLAMEKSEADVSTNGFLESTIDHLGNGRKGSFEGQGGAIYNRGDITVDGDAVFYDNDAADGGGIYQEKWGTFEINGMTNFTLNNAFDALGGTICNLGGIVNLNGGSVFHSNGASCSGDCGSGGAIYNYDGGVITLTGQTTFSDNAAWFGGAIYNRKNISSFFDDEEIAAYKVPVITFPDDTVFTDNRAICGPDFFDGDYDVCTS